MKFGISNNIKSRVVRECTPELFHQAMRSELVAESWWRRSAPR